MRTWLAAAHLVLAWALMRRHKRSTRDESDAVKADGPWGRLPGRQADATAGAASLRSVARHHHHHQQAAQASVHPHALIIEQLSQHAPPLQLPPRHGVAAPSEPLCSGREHYAWIDTPLQLAAAAMDLYEQDRVALDVEHHATHSYAGDTCLLQLSTGTKDFLIDTLALRQDLYLLAPVLSNPRICKVVHGGGNDIMWLQRDFRLFLVNCFDTEKACQVLGYKQRSLAFLLQRFCGIQIDKSLGQLADWRQRPLPSPLVEYARRDVHHLLFLADCLGQELVVEHAQHLPYPALAGEQHQQQKQGDQEEEEERQEQLGCPLSVLKLSPEAHQDLDTAMALPHSWLRRAVHRSQAVTLTLCQPPLPTSAVGAAAVGLMRQAVPAALKQHSRLTPPQLQHLETVADCVHVLADWRDAAAREADEGLQCLLPDAVLLQLAEAAASGAMPGVGNLRGRQQGLDGQQLLDLLPAAGQNEDEEAPVGGGTSCGCYPHVLQEQASQVAALLCEAACGQRPWINADVQQLLAEAGGHGSAGLSAGGSKSAKQHDPAAFRQQLAQRFAAKSAVYENCRMYSQEGELLCHTDRKKLEWYMEKRLAVKVSDEPLAVRLTFQHHAGDQRQGTSDYYTIQKSNQCVACGEAGHYLRYRVVPACYRRAMPERLKSHRSHDIILLCCTCHALAATAADKLKRRLADELGVPLLPALPQQCEQQQQQQAAAAGSPAPDGSNQCAEGAVAGARGSGAAQPSAQAELDLHPFNVRRSALALQRYAHQMPEAKRRQLETQVRRFVGMEAPAQETETPAGLTELEQYGGLLAGLGRKTRRRTLKCWVQEGRKLPAPLAAEAAAAAGGAGGAAEDDEGKEGDGVGGHDSILEANTTAAASDIGLSALRNTGHMWHGQQLVERLAARGGDEALLQLCCRFRQCFVEALQPQFLPAGWAVQHVGKRAFGAHSIYHE